MKVGTLQEKLIQIKDTVTWSCVTHRWQKDFSEVVSNENVE